MLVFSESFKQFIKRCDNKIAYHLASYIESNYPVYDLVFTDEFINYITFRNDGTISYLPKGKEHKENSNGDWAREGRQNAKPSTTIQKIITKKGMELFKKVDFESFTNCYKCEFSDEDLVFNLLDNKCIPNIYREDCLDGESSLNNSCMRNESSEFFDIYFYCKDVSILTLRKDGVLAGRALIWKMQDITLMDRVYIAKEQYYQLFFNYSTEHKYWRKRRQSYDYKDEFYNESGEAVNRIFKISTDTDHSCYPYIDTFSYGDDGFLTNSCGGYDYTYHNTDGTRDGGEDEDNSIYDEIDDNDIDRDDAITVTRGRYRNNTTHVDNTVDIDGETWWEDDDDIVYVSGKYYEKDSDDIAINALTDDYELMRDLIHIDNGYYAGEYINDNKYVSDVDDNIWWEEDEGITQVEDTWYPKDHEDIELVNKVYQLKQEYEIA